MGFVDVFYYGQNKLICKSLTSADNGKTVSITNSAGRSWSGTIADKKCEFMLPPRDVYSVSILGTGGVAQNTQEVMLGFGECRTLIVGYDKSSAYSIKQMLKAGVVNDYFEVGDQIMVSEGASQAAYDVLEIGYNGGNNIIFGRHDLLSNDMAMISETASLFFTQTDVSSYLNGAFYNSLNNDFKDNISDYEFKTAKSNAQSNSPVYLQTAKIWLPSEVNVMGTTHLSALEEVSVGGATQFSYFAVLANRIKSKSWWTASGYKGSSSNSFTCIDVTGNSTSKVQTGAYSVAPCFMIDDQ